MDEHGDACSRRGLEIRQPDRRTIMVRSKLTQTSPVTGERSGALLQAALAVAVGALLLGIVGFVQIDAMHNAAHDTRHATGFPCH